MTSAIGQNIPLLAQNRPSSAQPAAESDPLAFDKVLNGEGHAALRQRETGHDHALHPAEIDRDEKAESSPDGASKGSRRHVWPLDHYSGGNGAAIRASLDGRQDVEDQDKKSEDGMGAAQNGLHAALHAFGEGKASQEKSDIACAEDVAILPSSYSAAAGAERAPAMRGGEKRSVQPEPVSGLRSLHDFASRLTATPDDDAPLQAASGADDAPAVASDGLARGRDPDAGMRPSLLPRPDVRASAGERVSVLAAQSIPAPAQHPVGPTILGLVDKIANDRTWQNTVLSPGLAAMQPGTGPAHMLKIELHPAELGTVHVGLRLAGGQLSIEITPHTHEAYRHLASDTDAITRSMRDLGFDVGKVTLLQPTIAVTTAGRPDAGAMTANGREQSFQQQGHTGNGGSGGQQAGNGQGRAQGHTGPVGAHGGDGAGRGLVI
jgi:chemotaxis protein MotD